jgi:hypothetical protein
MRWRTPGLLATHIASRLERYRHSTPLRPGTWPLGSLFGLDACAEPGYSYGHHSFTAARSCLLHDWPDVETAFVNPPYGPRGVPRKVIERGGGDPSAFERFPGISAFIERAIHWTRQVRWTQETGRLAAVLVPASMDRGRFAHLRRAHEVILLGRVKFVDLDGLEQRSPPGAHMVLIYRSPDQVSGYDDDSQEDPPGQPGPVWTVGAPWALRQRKTA